MRNEGLALHKDRGPEKVRLPWIICIWDLPLGIQSQHIVRRGCSSTKRLGRSSVMLPKTKVPIGSRDRNKRCKFHNDHNHNTDECIALRYAVVELLKKGHLVNLLTKWGQQNWKITNDPMQNSPKPADRYEGNYSRQIQQRTKTDSQRNKSSNLLQRPKPPHEVLGYRNTIRLQLNPRQAMDSWT